MEMSNFRKCMFAGLLLAAFASAGLAGGEKSSPKFYYDNGGAKMMAESQTVCVSGENDLYLTPKIKYYFRYDESGRVTEKKALRWDAVKKGWSDDYLLRFTYKKESVAIELALWNESKGRYDDFSQRTIIEVDVNMLTAVSHYRKDSNKEHNWVLAYNHLISTPSDSPWHENAVLFAGIND